MYHQDQALPRCQQHGSQAERQSKLVPELPREKIFVLPHSMAEMPDHILSLLAELTALVGASAAIAYVGQRFLRLVPLVGFLMTGVVIGPHALGLVSDEQLVEGAAEVGVILLLFTIGIEFSLERLARIRRLVFGGGALQVLLTLAGVAAILVVFGVSWSSAIYTGCLAALSSTIIALKLLTDASEIGSEHGQAALGVLIFQDMAVVGMVLLLPVLAGQGDGWWGVASTLAKAVGIIAAVLLLARRAMPVVLERIARACSPDIFLLSPIEHLLRGRPRHRRDLPGLGSLAPRTTFLEAGPVQLVSASSGGKACPEGDHLLVLKLLLSVEAFRVSVGMKMPGHFLRASRTDA